MNITIEVAETGLGTRVLDDRRAEIPGVAAIDWNITPEGSVATFRFHCVPGHGSAIADIDDYQLEQLAQAKGYCLAKPQTVDGQDDISDGEGDHLEITSLHRPPVAEDWDA